MESDKYNTRYGLWLVELSENTILLKNGTQGLSVTWFVDDKRWMEKEKQKYLRMTTGILKFSESLENPMVYTCNNRINVEIKSWY